MFCGVYFPIVPLRPFLTLLCLTGSGAYLALWRATADRARTLICWYTFAFFEVTCALESSGKLDQHTEWYGAEFRREKTQCLGKLLVKHIGSTGMPSSCFDFCRLKQHSSREMSKWNPMNMSWIDNLLSCLHCSLASPLCRNERRR